MRLSTAASEAIESAEVLAVAAISWFELAWLAANGRVVITVPLRCWLDRLAEHVVTLPIDPAIAAAAVALPNSFTGDPADRLIYATAITRGLRLVTVGSAGSRARAPSPCGEPPAGAVTP